MAIEKKPAAYIWEAICDADVEDVKKLFAQYPDQINTYIPFGGGTFLHLAASEPSLDMVKCLVEIGFDINKMSSAEGDAAIADACRNGHYGIVEYLLDKGAAMDVSDSVRNPLFGAIVGRSVDIAKLLIERGIDTSARYPGDDRKGMDAIAFALERGESNIARVIAEWNAKGDMAKAEALLAEGMEIARLNNQ